MVGSPDPAAELTPTAAAVLAAVPAWWAARASQAGLDGDWLDVHFAVPQEPPLVLSEAPPLEAEWGPLTPEEVGAAYVAALSPSTRAQHGRHYTPPALAAQLWEMARAGLGIKTYPTQLPGLVRDPASGAGALLLPILREHLAATYSSDPQIALNRLPMMIEGIDTDPAAVWIANILLAAEMLPTLARVPAARRRALPTLVRVGDGISSGLEKARVVIMNPPYGRVKLNEADRERFADTLYGHANLYGLFLASAASLLEKDGVLAALVPTSFTAGRYFDPLRRKLSSQTKLQEIRFVADRSGVFSSVLQETCLATFTTRRIRKTVVKVIGSEVSYVATVKSPTGGNPWILPRRSDLAPTAARASNLPLTLADVGWRVSTGPLVWNRRKKDLHARPGKDRYPVIWAADIDGGTLHRDRVRAGMRYLATASESDRKVMLTHDPCILVQRTTAPEQRRRLVAATISAKEIDAIGGAFVAENHVNVIRPVKDDPPVSRDLLGRLLSSNALDQVVRCMSGSVALSAYELESIPLPSLDTLAKWEELPVDELELAVSACYSGSEDIQ